MRQVKFGHVSGAASLLLTENCALFTWRSKPSGFAAYFLPVWIIGWFIGCIVLSFHLVAAPAVFEAMFLLVAWAFWWLGCFYFVRMHFERGELRLDHRGVSHTYCIVFDLVTRHLPLHEVHNFRPFDLFDEHAIEISTVGRPLRIGVGISDVFVDVAKLHDERRCIERAGSPAKSIGRIEAIGLLNERLVKLREGTTFSDAVSGVTSSPTSVDISDPLREEIVYVPTGLKRPSECRLSVEVKADGIYITKSEWFDGGAFTAMVIINVIWQCCVIVVILDVLSGDQGQLLRGMQLLSIAPFALVGVLLFVVLMLVAFGPLFLRHWLVTDEVIVYHVGCCWGVRETNVLTTKVCGMRVQRVSEENEILRSNWWFPQTVFGRGRGIGSQYDLALLDVAGGDVYKFTGLMEGEALWLADSLLRALGH